MARNHATGDANVVAFSDRKNNRPARSTALAEKGIRTSQDLAGIMSATVCDVLTGKLPVEQATAAAYAAGKLLKTIEMQFKYGRPRQPHATLDFAK